VTNDLTPCKAIRKFCVDMCSGGNPKAPRICEDKNCPLWQYRLGKNPKRTGIGNKPQNATRRKIKPLVKSAHSRQNNRVEATKPLITEIPPTQLIGNGDVEVIVDSREKKFIIDGKKRIKLIIEDMEENENRD
jgi:hypothetical protein